MEMNEGIDVLAPVPPKNKKPIKIRVSLFFDGTLNSRTNALERVRPPDPAHPDADRRKNPGSESYENDFSNVARTETLLLREATNYQHYVHVYTEGIGTVDTKPDDQRGYATGSGLKPR